MSDLAPAVKPKPLEAVEATVKAIESPHRNLLWLYIIQMLLVFPAAPFIFLPMYFHYHTLKYRFDDDGVHASWGILLRREVSLTYARIQDIHLRRGLFERWLGLGSVQIQTASGAGASDLVIEGLTAFDEVRDFLYAKMRGATSRPRAPARPAALTAAGASVDTEAVKLLVEIRDDLKAVRDKLEAARGGGAGA